MPDFRRRTCAEPPRGCGKNDRDVGPISWRGLCETCGSRNMNANHDQLIAHTGPFAQHHRRQCVAAWGGVLLDDLRDTA